MILRLVGIVLAFVVGGSAVAQRSPPLPKDVPPLIGVAIVGDPGQGGESEWTVELTLPRIAWQVVGEVVPKKQWPELKTEVEKTTLTLRMGGLSQLAPSRIVDLRGRALGRTQVVSRLKWETPVLVSVSGRMPDPYFLQLTKPDALIVILGARDGYPAPDLLPARKAPVTG
jgi:hypothetical protein